MFLSLLAAAPAVASAVRIASSEVPAPEIVVTASLSPVAEEEAPATVTVIDAARIEALGEPLTADLLRLVPGVSVATSGPPGTQTQLRIRGAEANHTLLLIDGIRFNDPASSNEPRFELLSNEGVERIEVVRGPQSALYGAEAIGGVVALYTGRASPGTSLSAAAEAGSHNFFRGSGTASSGSDDGSITLYSGYQRSSGIDIRGGGGEQDGYKTLTVSGTGRLRLSEVAELSLSGRFVDATSEFDGSDPVTFKRADTLDETRNRIGAARLAVTVAPTSGWELAVGGTFLSSTNRNRRGETALNRTSGERKSVDLLFSTGLSTGSIRHTIILGGDYEDEAFVARDQAFGGATNQNRVRGRGALVGEWRASLRDRLTTDIAVRHDSFEGFKDATTLRGSVLVGIYGPLSALIGYGEGIARPNFFELFGFFPGSFVGNPGLRPERSRGFEAGLRYRTDRVSVNLTGYRQRLDDEIVTVFDSKTFLSSVRNATGESRRTGFEVEGEWRPLANLGVTATYAYLDAEEQQVRDGSLTREVRRPRHSGSLGLNGDWGRFTGGMSLAYVGNRSDLDFDVFPARRVTLGDYVLANARIAYRLTDSLELFGRVANAFDADYEDVVGFATQGRTAYAGLRLRFGE